MRRRDKERIKATIRNRIRAHMPKRSGLNFRRHRIQVQSKDVLRVSLLVAEIAAAILLAYFLNIGFFTRVTCSGESMESAIPENATTWVNRVIYHVTEPESGDVIAFLPQGLANHSYSIKRVVAVPGDTVQIIDGELYVNGEETELQNDDVSITDAGLAEEEITLGEDEYFVLGDAVNTSEDSRYSTVGNVKLSEIYGKVWFITSFPGIGFVR